MISKTPKKRQTRVFMRDIFMDNLLHTQFSITSQNLSNLNNYIVLDDNVISYSDNYSQIIIVDKSQFHNELYKHFNIVKLLKNYLGLNVEIIIAQETLKDTINRNTYIMYLLSMYLKHIFEINNITELKNAYAIFKDLHHNSVIELIGLLMLLSRCKFIIYLNSSKFNTNEGFSMLSIFENIKNNLQIRIKEAITDHIFDTDLFYLYYVTVCEFVFGEILLNKASKYKTNICILEIINFFFK